MRPPWAKHSSDYAFEATKGLLAVGEKAAGIIDTPIFSVKAMVETANALVVAVDVGFLAHSEEAY